MNDAGYEDFMKDTFCGFLPKIAATWFAVILAVKKKLRAIRGEKKEEIRLQAQTQATGWKYQIEPWREEDRDG